MTSESPHPQPRPRPFSQATGLIFQVAGLLLALGGCCGWSLSGRFQAPTRPTEPARHAVDWLAGAPAAQVWGMLAVCVEFAGGMGLIVAGLGLQHLLGRKGRAAVMVSGLGAAFHAAWFVAACWSFPGAGTIAGVGLLGAVWGVLFLMAGAAAEEMARLPAPTREDSSWTQGDEDDLRRGPSPPARGGTNP
jgi:hypothetical protein